MQTNEMPAASVFIDSTTLLYSHDSSEPNKRDIARRWLEALAMASAGRCNLQVLNEVTNTLIRKSTRFGSEDPFARVEAFSGFGQSELTLSTTLVARNVFVTYRYSWWDCILLASAIELGCTHFLSEDLQDGQQIVAEGRRGLTIVNPFAHSPAQILVS
jgi:predicted nucleic acid-binding protein